jgi:hypothetical protein
MAERPKMVPSVSLGANDLSKRNGFSVSGLFWGGSTKYPQAQLSIAYATGEMPVESRHFMSNRCPDVECRFEIFLRWIGHQWCENHLV